MDKEYRIYLTKDLRVEGEGPDKKIFGYAAKFNRESPERWGWKEVIEPGFFRKALQDTSETTYGLLNHNEDFILAERNIAHTMTLVEDAVGLAFEMAPADNARNNDFVISPIERKELGGCSFGFQMFGRGVGYELEEDEETGQVLQRLLPDGCKRLFDVGPVAFPFYADTEASVRSLTAARIKEFRQSKQAKPMTENNRALLMARARTRNIM